MRTRIVARKAKQGDSPEEFRPQESDSIMSSLADTLKKVSNASEERIHDGERLKQISLKTDSFSCYINHVPMDTFGERHAEIRAVLRIEGKSKAVKDAMTEMDFDVSVTS